MVSYTLLGREVEEVYDDNLHVALSKLDSAFFMPDLIRSRLSTEDDHRVWRAWWTTPSIRATGKTSSGTPVVLYAHVSNFYSDAAHIRSAVEGKRLVHGAGVLSQDEFARLLGLEGNGVCVVDYHRLKNSPFGLMSLSQALEHPQTVPFFGVSEEEAQSYMGKHKRIYGEKIGIWHREDLGSEPVARVLFLGMGNYLDGNLDLNLNGHFVGVRRRASESEPIVRAEGATQNISQAPSLEEVLALSRDFVAPKLLLDWETLLRSKYQ